MFVIVLISDGTLRFSTTATDLTQVETVLKEVHELYYSHTDEEGFIAVEKVNNPGEIAKRLLHIGLNAELEDVESALESIMIKNQ